jgi:hypothetical protein
MDDLRKQEHRQLSWFVELFARSLRLTDDVSEAYSAAELALSWQPFPPADFTAADLTATAPKMSQTATFSLAAPARHPAQPCLDILNGALALLDVDNRQRVDACLSILVKEPSKDEPPRPSLFQPLPYRVTDISPDLVLSPPGAVPTSEAGQGGSAKVDEGGSTPKPAAKKPRHKTKRRQRRKLPKALRVKRRKPNTDPTQT